MVWVPTDKEFEERFPKQAKANERFLKTLQIQRETELEDTSKEYILQHGVFRSEILNVE